MLELSAPLSRVSGIGPRFLVKLKKLKIETVRDLISHYPTRYEDFSQIYRIADLEPNQEATIQGEIKEIGGRRTWRRHLFLVEALVSDESGSIRAVWFNQPYIRNVLRPGRVANFSGKVVSGEEDVYLSNPVYELVDTGRETKHTGRIVPVYPETKGLTSKGLRYLVKPVLDQIEKIPEILPLEILRAENLPEINKTIQNIHFPKSLEEALAAKKRLAFEDLFLLQLQNLKQKMNLAREKTISIKTDVAEIRKLIEALPFELTPSQKQSLWEIIQDLGKNHPMNRLLQGDVGSGKTIVAAIAAILTAYNGHQSAFMAPTEILAQQHYQTMTQFFPKFEEGLALLTSTNAKVFYGRGLETKKEKSILIREIGAGRIKIVVGTHALIQKKVSFKNLALVVIDEQHRFGVSQRKALTRGQTQTEISQTDADKLLYRDITYKIRGCVFQIKNEVGLGHKESVYQKALSEAMITAGLQFEREKKVPILYRGKEIGVYQPDFVVENKVMVELKALPFIGATESKQAWQYAKGSPYKLVLFINFGPRSVDIKRIVYDTARSPRKSAIETSPRESAALMPHFLSMSATPIPRTLSLTIFGDLDLSLIREMPKNRKPIVTKIVAAEDRSKAYAFIRSQIKCGRQAFVICPRIAAPENGGEPRPTTSWAGKNIEWQKLEIKSVKEEYQKLKTKIFPDRKIIILHGRMKPAEKEKTVREFYGKKADILVSTSVVEVGIDVPNATVMMIEGADRFGLAQLYQFRGRVGRGEHQSFCFLFTDSSSSTTRERLKSIVEAKNGFELAERDLQIRGPGEFLGQSQTGMPDIAMKAIQNPELVKTAREAAVKILKKDPSLKTQPKLLERLNQFQKEVHWE